MTVDVDVSGPAAPPRRNGELVFEAPWQGRVFGMCVALLAREGLGWERVRRHLVPRVAADPGGEYYEHLAGALADLVEELDGP